MILCKPDSIQIPLITLLPFVLILLSIAVFPLFWNHFWEKNKNKLIIAIVLSIPVVIYLLLSGLTEKLVDTIVFDYIPFIILLGSLFTITGGIFLSGDIEAKPWINTLFLTGWCYSGIICWYNWCSNAFDQTCDSN